jgi:hypothetical protein
MNKKTILKTLVIGLIAILVISGVTSSAISQTKQINHIKPVSMPSWSDNFDSYANDQFLDGTPDDGGWKGWDNYPSAGAYVRDDLAYSTPHSVEVAGATDLVHEYSGYTAGQWNYTAWQYVPDNFTGLSYFIMLSDYIDGAGELNSWAVQVRFDSDLLVAESEYDSVNLPLIQGRWVELRVEIDLEADWFTFYYDGDVLVEKAWTATPNNDFTGFKVISAVDLYANAASPVYYDDMSLEGEAPPAADLDCEGSLTWTDINAGATVTGEIQVSNIGETGSLLDWEVATYPVWGTWTFTPSSGTDLEVGSSTTIDVSVVAPSEKNAEFTGIVKLVNSNDASDFCEIDASLTTPRARTNSIILRILERFPNAFPILRNILNL